MRGRSAVKMIRKEKGCKNICKGLQNASIFRIRDDKAERWRLIRATLRSEVKAIRRSMVTTTGRESVKAIRRRTVKAVHRETVKTI